MPPNISARSDFASNALSQTTGNETRGSSTVKKAESTLNSPTNTTASKKQVHFESSQQQQQRQQTNIDSDRSSSNAASENERNSSLIPHPHAPQNYPFGGVGGGYGYGGASMYDSSAMYGGGTGSMYGGGGYGSPYYGGGFMSPFGGMAGGAGGGPLSNLNQFLFSVQSVIFSLGQAVQIIGMNTQALQQLFESLSSMMDHAVQSWNEMRALETAAHAQETEEMKKKRRRLRALRLALVAAVSYVGYRLVRRLLRPRRSVATLTGGTIPNYSFSGGQAPPAHQQQYNYPPQYPQQLPPPPPR